MNEKFFSLEEEESNRKYPSLSAKHLCEASLAEGTIVFSLESLAG